MARYKHIDHRTVQFLQELRWREILFPKILTVRSRPRGGKRFSYRMRQEYRDGRKIFQV